MSTRSTSRFRWAYFSRPRGSTRGSSARLRSSVVWGWGRSTGACGVEPFSVSTRAPLPSRAARVSDGDLSASGIDSVRSHRRPRHSLTPTISRVAGRERYGVSNRIRARPFEALPFNSPSMFVCMFAPSPYAGRDGWRPTGQREAPGCPFRGRFPNWDGRLEWADASRRNPSSGEDLSDCLPLDAPLPPRRQLDSLS